MKKNKITLVMGVLLALSVLFGCKNPAADNNTGNNAGDDVEPVIVDNPNKQNSEWLMLMYMDGDNNLNDPIYIDLNEAEYGLAQLPAGSSVRIIALWDGWDFVTNNDPDNPETSQLIANAAAAGLTLETASTKLLELGADGRGEPTTVGGITLSPNTKDLTATVDWIKNNEVNMASEKTLEYFLKWVKANYTADKIIIQFSNHGGGPRSATNGKKYGRRSMCWDETSTDSSLEACLKTSDVSKALKNACFGGDNKVSLIMEDVCLGGSIEEAYELKDYSDYYVGSPNNVPGWGFDYVSFVSSLTKNATVEEVGCNLVKTYSENYKWSDNDWTEYLSDEDNQGYASLSAFEKSINVPDLSTLSFIDLSKVDAVKDAVNELAQLIYFDTENEYRIQYDDKTNKLYYKGDDGKYYSYNGGILATEDIVLKPVSRWFAIKFWTAYYGDPIYYSGTFGCLKDLGAMCVYMRNYYSESDWLGLNEKANAVTAALSDAVVASWRDGYGQPTYYKNKAENKYQAVFGTSDLGAGLTINCCCWVDSRTHSGNPYGFENWYKNELAFGRDCSAWTELIESWWN